MSLQICTKWYCDTVIYGILKYTEMYTVIGTIIYNLEFYVKFPHTDYATGSIW